MPQYSDLSDCDYFDPGLGRLIAIGWLGSDAEYSRGEVTRDFFRALMQLLANPWQPMITAGTQKCPFCRFSGGPKNLQVDGILVPLGASNLFIPNEDSIYVAPSMIAHYIDSHVYAPPIEFQKAVLSCPPMRSMSYFKLVRKHGGQIGTERSEPQS